MSPDQLQRLLITAMTLMGRNGTQDGTCSSSNYAKPIGITALKPLLSKATSCASIDALVHATCQRCCPSSMREVQPNKYCQPSTIQCALNLFEGASQCWQYQMWRAFILCNLALHASRDSSHSCNSRVSAKLLHNTLNQSSFVFIFR